MHFIARKSFKQEKLFVYDKVSVLDENVSLC